MKRAPIKKNPNTPLGTEPVVEGRSASIQARLTLAAQALEIYRTSCFWSLKPGFAVTETALPMIAAGLRRHGDRAAFQLAAQLCP